MPCIAMGIPVVFLYDKSKRNDYRVSIIEDLIGIQYVGESRLDRVLLNRRRGKNIDWSPKPLAFEDEKQRIRDAYLATFAQAAERYQSHHSNPK